MPAATSEPGRRTLPPDRVGARIATAAGTSEAPAGASVSSTGTTVSAPAGIIAPVMIRSAVPGPTSSSGARPAGTSPRTRSTTGRSADAPATSATRTANPSMALFGHGGSVRAERTGSASARPAASARSTVTAGRASTPSSTRRRASSSGIRSGRSGMEALRAAGRSSGRQPPGSSGYAGCEAGPAICRAPMRSGPATHAARMGSAAGPVERTPKPRSGPCERRSRQRVAYDSSRLHRRGPENMRHEPVQMARPPPNNMALTAHPRPEPTLAGIAVLHAGLVTAYRSAGTASAWRTR